jgi:hypothetical protein
LEKKKNGIHFSATVGQMRYTDSTGFVLISERSCDSLDQEVGHVSTAQFQPLVECYLQGKSSADIFKESVIRDVILPDGQEYSVPRKKTGRIDRKMLATYVSLGAFVWLFQVFFVCFIKHVIYFL